jgi:hypothetical protein
LLCKNRLLTSSSLLIFDISFGRTVCLRGQIYLYNMQVFFSFASISFWSSNHIWYLCILTGSRQMSQQKEVEKKNLLTISQGHWILTLFSSNHQKPNMSICIYIYIYIYICSLMWLFKGFFPRLIGISRCGLFAKKKKSA